jgi:hypothetical protein
MKTSLTLEWLLAGQRSSTLGVLPGVRRQHFARGVEPAAPRFSPSALGVPALTLEIAKKGPVLRGAKRRGVSQGLASSWKQGISGKAREGMIRENRERASVNLGVVATQAARYQILERVLSGGRE